MWTCFVAPLRVFLQELFIGEELLWDALNHIQPVHPKHNLSTSVALEKPRNVGFYFRHIEGIREPLRLDAYGEGRDAGELPVVLDSLGCSLGAELRELHRKAQELGAREIKGGVEVHREESGTGRRDGNVMETDGGRGRGERYLKAKDASARRHKVPGIVVGVEAYQIGL